MLLRVANIMIFLIGLTGWSLYGQAPFPAWMVRDSGFLAQLDVRNAANMAAYCTPYSGAVYLCPPSSDGPLTGLRIALDPGHGAVNMAEGKLEGKFVQALVGDTLMGIYESGLNLQTALLLADTLRKLGACVMLSRDVTTPGIRTYYEAWTKGKRLRVWPGDLDSAGFPKGPAPGATLATYNHQFFKYADLWQRAREINAFQPHATLCMHLNVEEKNVANASGITRLHGQQYAMVFVSGGYVRTELAGAVQRGHFYRQLATRSPERSVALAQALLQGFEQKTGIPTVKRDAPLDYLQKNSMFVAPGVYARNLYFLRQICGPVVLTEPLLQDEEKWFQALASENCISDGRRYPCALHRLVEGYVFGIQEWWKKEKGHPPVSNEKH